METFVFTNQEFDYAVSETGRLILTPVGKPTLIGFLSQPGSYRAPGPGERQVKKPKIEKVRRKTAQEFLLPRKFKTQNAKLGVDEENSEKAEAKTREAKAPEKADSEKSVKANKFQRRFKKTKKNVRV